MEKTSAKEIICSVGMCERPEYYLGRGARTSDLDGNKLYSIYQKITQEIGEKQAKTFVNMIKEMKMLSATNFLNAFYELEQNNWELNISERNTKNYDVTEAIAFATLSNVISDRNQRDDTDWIKSVFLRKIRYGD